MSDQGESSICSRPQQTGGSPPQATARDGGGTAPAGRLAEDGICAD